MFAPVPADDLAIADDLALAVDRELIVALERIAAVLARAKTVLCVIVVLLGGVIVTNAP